MPKHTLLNNGLPAQSRRPINCNQNSHFIKGYDYEVGGCHLSAARSISKVAGYSHESRLLLEVLFGRVVDYPVLILFRNHKSVLPYEGSRLPMGDSPHPKKAHNTTMLSGFDNMHLPPYGVPVIHPLEFKGELLVELYYTN